MDLYVSVKLLAALSTIFEDHMISESKEAAWGMGGNCSITLMFILSPIVFSNICGRLMFALLAY